MIHEATVTALRERPEWQQLQAYIEEEVAKLDRVSDITATDPAAIATETLARQRALTILKNILEPFDLKETPSFDLSGHTLEKTGLN